MIKWIIMAKGINGLKELDMQKRIYKARGERWRKIAIEWIKINPQHSDEKCTVDYEKVKNYSCKILTCRIGAEIVFREFPVDMYGVVFKYKSSIFGDKME